MNALRPLVELLKALAHPVRLRILALLRDGELCVCQVAEILRLAHSTVSEHLTDLRRAGLVQERKVGRWVHVALTDAAASRSVLESLWPLMASAAADLDRDQAHAREVRCSATAPVPCSDPVPDLV